MTPTDSDFYIITREPGAEHPAIPTWASHRDNSAQLDPGHPPAGNRIEITDVPGAFQLPGVLSPAECERLVTMTETLGYLADAAVSLPRSIRHNDNATWIADDETNQLIWERCAPGLRIKDGILDDHQALGLNARYRFYRYGPGDYFAPHTDGAWPGSRIIDGKLVADAYGDRYSLLTLLLFLSEDYRGGETTFLVSKSNPGQPARSDHDAREVAVRTSLGDALCFPHGSHPLHCVHASTPIVSGHKYIIRSDVLFGL